MWGQYIIAALIGFGIATILYIIPKMIFSYKESIKIMVKQTVIEYLKELQTDTKDDITTPSKTQINESKIS